MLRRMMAALVILVLAVAVGTNAEAADKTPAPGTVITQSNWQQYKEFLPAQIKAMLRSTSENKIVGWPSGAKIVVGPSHHYPLPSSYWKATEKYSKQVQLVKVPKGSYTLKGYVAGEPFPNLSPNDPLAGYKLMYDVYFSYRPAIQAGDHIQVEDMDRYGNESDLHALVINYTWMHITDAGYPMNLPHAGGVYFTVMAEQLDPEQIKYVTALNLTWDDPNRYPESYVFLPSLRRAIRLSSAARCAPFQGQDFANDDVTPTPLPPTWFSAKFINARPILEYVFKPDSKTAAEATKRSNWDFSGGNFIPKTSVFGASWELRQVYTVDMQRLPQYAPGYCYARHEQDFDKEQAQVLGWSAWDQNNKFWRDMIPFSIPMKDGDGTYLYTSGWAHDNCDYQNFHCSVLLPPIDGAYINQATPAQFQNRTLYGTPAGLQQIMR